MNHQIIQDEIDATSKIDFIVPLKQVGLITKAVLEAIWKFYRPRRIIVVTAEADTIALARLAPYWDCGGVVECMAEEKFFMPNFGLTLEDIKAQYGYGRPGNSREPGWWIQQLIKFGAGSQIPDISDVYTVWDGDLVPIRRWRLCERNARGGFNWYIAILQAEARSEFNTTQYSQCMEAMTGFTPLDPEGGGTFVAHHMVFHKKYITELLDLMMRTTKSSLPWPQMIMSYSKQFYRFSEYKTYTTFMKRYHPEHFFFHPLSCFGEGGLRFREANDIIANMLESCPFVNGGISYDQVHEFTMKEFEAGSEDGCSPPYVQLDHVYGLEGIDLNMIGEPLHKFRPPMQIRGPGSDSSSSSSSSSKISFDGLDEGTTRGEVAPPSPARFGRVRVGARSDLVDPRRSFSLLAFSQLKELKEITNPEDFPRDLFVSPVNVAVVEICAEETEGVSQQGRSGSSPPRSQQRGRDDSSIKRMTMGSMLNRNSPFSKDQRTTMTTPRRPVNQRFYLCPPSTGLNRSTLSSLFLPPSLADEAVANGAMGATASSVAGFPVNSTWTSIGAY